MSLHIAVLLTCYNRKKITLKCINDLSIQENNNAFKLSIFLVDDKSTDGTKEEVLFRFPNVKIIDGTGNLFWGGGMHLAWKTAINSSVSYDYFLWLNDDTLLYDSVLHDMIEASQAKDDNVIVCGPLCDELTRCITTYSGHRNYRYPEMIEPNGTFQNCEFCNGNLLLIPSKIVNKVGIIDPYFRHYLGDYEYSARVVKAGFECIIMPFFCGVSDFNENVARFKCFSRNISVIKRIKLLYSPKGINPLREFKYFSMFSYCYAIAVFIDLHLMTLLPLNYKRFKRFVGINI